MNRLRTRLRASIADGPLVLLDFISGGLDPRITFSRGSNATLVDSTGKITYAPANLLTFSEQFDNAAWLKQAGGTASVPVVTANAGTAPDGTETADRVQMTLNGGTTVSDAANVSQAAAYPAGSILQSIWLRSNTGLNQTVYLVIGNTQPAGGLVTVTPTWQRFAVTQSVATAGSSNSGIRLRGTFTGDTADILVWGAQLEPVTYQTTPSTYNPTTTAAYYGPRFDYDPVTLAPKGLLIEEQRTNLLTYSQDFTNATWTKSLSAMAGTFTTAPDGTNTGAKWREDNTTNQHAIYATPSLTAVAYTETWYLKAAERTKVQVSLATAGLAYGASVIADLSAGTLSAVTNAGGHTGATATIISAGNGWYRVSLTITATAATYYPALTMVTGTNTTNYLGDGTSGIFIWGAQVEAGSFATSYIPTVASTVTRSADVATMTGTNFSSWYNQTEGTIVASVDTVAPTGSTILSFQDGAGASTNRQQMNVYTTCTATVVGGVTQSNMGINTSAAVNLAYAYKANDFAASANGGTVATDTSGTVPTTLAYATLGKWDYGTAASLNGHIRQIAYYNTRLSNTQLQTLTAPSLATTLSLSFTNQVYTVGV